MHPGPAVLRALQPACLPGLPSPRLCWNCSHTLCGVSLPATCPWSWRGCAHRSGNLLGRPASGRRLEEYSAMATVPWSWLFNLWSQPACVETTAGPASVGPAAGVASRCVLICVSLSFRALPSFQAHRSPSHPCSLSNWPLSVSHLQPPGTRHHPASQRYGELLPHHVIPSKPLVCSCHPLSEPSWSRHVAALSP